MPTTSARIIRVFLASPGDVSEERAQARHLIKDDLPTLPFIKDRAWLKIVAWEDPSSRAPMPATLSPQKAIELGMTRPSECDIVVVVFWSRMGTPLDEARHGLKDGIRPYWSGTEWEYLDALAASEEMGKPVVLVYRRTAKVPMDPDAHDFDERVDQLKRVKEFFAEFRDPETGAWLRSYTEYETPEQFGEMLKADLLYYIQPMLEEPAPKETPPDELPPKIIWPPDKSPFPGLRAFTPDDAPVFFGRSRETDALLKQVNDRRFVAVVGASGSGKSSLVGAGLIPRLRDNAIPGSKDWLWARFTPGEVEGNPFSALAVALKLELPTIQLPGLVAKLWQQPALLINTVESALEGQPDWVELLLFIDQFEELFTLIRNDASLHQFIVMLNEITHSTRIRTVITLRADFYHRCLEYEILAELLRTGSFPLAAPGERALYDMITCPAARAGLTWEDESLPERILTDTGSEPGALALMAYTLDELHQACQRADSSLLSHATYDALGRVQGAIGARAEGVFSKLDTAAQDTLSHVFRELVEVDERGTATRQRAPLSRFKGNRAAQTLVERFTDARLLTTSGSDRDAVVEVAHEALFRHWARLKTWIDNTQSDLFLLRQVRQAVELWEFNGHRDDFLWTGQRLKDAQAMVARLNPRLNDAEWEFLLSEVDRLEEKLQDPRLSHPLRARISEQLHVIGDTRPGVGLRPDGLPDITWCAVPNGKIILERKLTFTVHPFFMAHHLITSVQFQAFLDDPEGFEDDRWWLELAKKEEEAGEQRFKFSNHPRENISWYDAAAFCRWLTAMLPADGWPEGFSPETNAIIRLPTEWEWQQAATGGEPQRIYPWGPDWDEGRRCNARESGLSRTVAVGMYPSGVSPYGVFDMSGNVMEWCLNEFDNPSRLGLGGSEARALRGGSWDSDKHHAQTTSRFRHFPSSRDHHRGFRIVCAYPVP